MSTHFEKLYQQLNHAQRQAVDQIEGTIMVIAGPGTGKTQVLTLRIANILLKTQALPENILALTFTEAGVAAMRKRLVSIVGPIAYRVNIYTFHGFANQVIQAYQEDFETILGFEAITELEQFEILEEIFQAHSFEKINPIGDPLYYVRPAMSAISELKRENVIPKVFAHALKQQLADFEQIPDLYNDKGRYKGQMKGKYKDQLKQIEKNLELVQVYEQYQLALQEKKYYDFDDMLLFLIQAMEQNSDLLLRLQEQYHYLLVDEHQDTNQAQNRIIELLADYYDNPNLFAVGDAKQAIYRFQGASLKNFLAIRQKFPQAQVITLEQNYRSTQLILDASHSLMSQDSWPEMDLPVNQALEANVSYVNQKISVVDISSELAEYHYVAEDISEQIKAGISPEEIAVLARTNADLNLLLPVLAEKEIPFVLESRRNILQELPIRKFIILLRAIASIGDDTALIPALYLDFLNIHPVDIHTVQSVAKEKDLSVWQLLTSLEKNKISLIKPNKLKHVYAQLIEWHSLTQEQTLDQTFARILRHCGILKTTFKTKIASETVNLFTSLYQQLLSKLQKQPNLTMTEFLQFLDLLNQHGISIKAQLHTGETQAVRLMTAHGSKGLEFDRVYVLNVYDGKWGNKRGGFGGFKLPYEYLGMVQETVEIDKNADDRRLFYVALTRARQSLMLSYASKRLDGKEQVPSQFIAEVDESLLETADTTVFDTHLLAEPAQLFVSQPDLDTSSPDYLEQVKQLVVTNFDQHGLSATALNNYLSCPWQYYFRNVVSLPEEKSLALIFGNMIHAVIHDYLLHRSVYDDKNKLLNKSKELLEKAVLTEPERQSLITKAEEIWPIYFDEVMQHWSKQNKSELWIAGVGLAGEIKLRGKLDMLEPLGDNRYRVVDFKTGKPKSRNQIEGKTKDSNGDYKRQLVFYKLLLDRYKDGLMKMDSGVIEFVQPTDTDQIRSESFSITNEEEIELVETITRVADEIKSLAFWNQRCDQDLCEYCAMREMMG